MGKKKSSSMSSKFLLILLLLILPTSFSLVDQDNKELGFICLPFTRKRNVGFMGNRDGVLAAITAKATLPVHKGFYYTKKNDTEVGHYYDPAYGLGQCRGDVTPQGCNDCLYNASKTIQDYHDQQCKSRGAIIWRNHCMLKYSDLNFLGKLDTIHVVSNLTSKGHGGLDLEVAIGHLMSDLRNNISTSKNSIYFATATRPWIKTKTTTIQMYGMAQCNGYLSRNDCVKCIGVAITNLFLRFIRRVGAIAAYGSCTLRYDNAPFF